MENEGKACPGLVRRKIDARSGGYGGPLGYDCFSISRGIKQNMQRKSQWKDKCVGTLWRTQKWKLSQGNYIHFCFSLNPQRVWSTFIPCWYNVTMAVPGRWNSLWYFCGIAVRATLFWADVLRMWPLNWNTGLSRVCISLILHEIYLHTSLWHCFLTLYCTFTAVTPKQNKQKIFIYTIYVDRFKDVFHVNLLRWFAVVVYSCLFIIHSFIHFPDPPCETWKDPCDPNPCRNGGICSEGPDGFLCHCPDGFAGLRCHIDCTQPACLEESNCTTGRQVRTRNQQDVL